MIRILVVEDDARLNKIVCQYLQNGGYMATAARAPGRPTTRCTQTRMT